MEDFFLRSPNFLSDKGVVALVIVSSLREDAERFIESCGLGLCLSGTYQNAFGLSF
jgi:hypothetical protein